MSSRGQIRKRKTPEDSQESVDDETEEKSLEVLTGRAKKRMKRKLKQGPVDAETTDPNALPRLIGAEEFIMARSREIKALTDKHTQKQPVRLVFQRLPRHLRRRAMSHNIHLVPRRLRAAAQKAIETTPVKAPKTGNRRKKRRPRYSMDSFARRAKKHMWLETHIWHAKRMHMKNMWGWRLARSPTDKGVRANYRAGRHLCTVYDTSYISCVQLDAPSKDAIVECLRLVLSPAGRGLRNQMYLSGSRQGTIMMYHQNQYPRGAIAPVNFQWRPNSAQNSVSALRLWIHAAVFNDVLRILENLCQMHKRVSIVSLQQDLLRFELTGHRSNQVLSNIIKFPQDTSHKSTRSMDTGHEQKDGDQRACVAHQVWSKIADLLSPSSLPSGCVIGLHIEDPRVKDPVQKFKVLKRSCEDKATPPPLHHNEIMSLLQHWPTEACHSPLWDLQVIKQHAENIKDKSEQKKNKPPKKVEFVPGGVDIMLIQRPGGNELDIGCGWDVIVPAEWGMPFFKALIYSGARAIGLQNRDLLLFEVEQPSFPSEYPDTTAGFMYENWTGSQARLIHHRKPPAKRVNYEKLMIQSPFQPDWCSLLKIDGYRSIEESKDVDKKIDPESICLENTRTLDSDSAGGQHPTEMQLDEMGESIDVNEMPEQSDYLPPLETRGKVQQSGLPILESRSEHKSSGVLSYPSATSGHSAQGTSTSVTSASTSSSVSISTSISTPTAISATLSQLEPDKMDTDSEHIVNDKPATNVPVMKQPDAVMSDDTTTSISRGPSISERADQMEDVEENTKPESEAPEVPQVPRVASGKPELSTTSIQNTTDGTDVSQPKVSSSSELILPFSVIRDRSVLLKFHSPDGISDLLQQKQTFARQLVRVTVRFNQRGKPKNNSLICLPRHCDLDALKQRKLSLLHSKSKKTQTQTHRDTIGYVTVGNFSLSRGQGHAVGFCSATALIDLFSLELSRKVAMKFKGFALVRNISSRNYFPVFLSVSVCKV